MYVLYCVSFVFFMFILKKTKIETFLLKICYIQTTMDYKSLNALYHLHPQIKDLVDENNELKKENEELKIVESALQTSQCLVQWLDPRCNAESPDKEHIDQFCKEAGYDNEIKQTLYEDFHIDEDDEDEDEELGHHWVRMSDGEEVKVTH